VERKQLTRGNTPTCQKTVNFKDSREGGGWGSSKPVTTQHKPRQEIATRMGRVWEATSATWCCYRGKEKKKKIVMGEGRD